MIDVEKHGIEAGDRIRITIEGVVTKGNLYDPFPYSVNGYGLSRWTPPVGCTDPTVEILEKADPAWWSAKVIKADIADPTGEWSPDRGEYLLNQDGDYWCGTSGDPHRDLLTNVEVIVP